MLLARRLLVLPALLLLAALPALAAPDLARGFVFHDRNADGVKQPIEEGLPDVAVSDGREVVRTDRYGAWALPAAEEAIYFVVKPSNWAPISGADGLPSFFYLHRPEGSPKGKFPGIAPTGPLPGSIDFGLVPSHEPSRFRVAVLGDTQVRNVREIGYLTRDILEPLAGEAVSFGLTLGDNGFDDLGVLPPLRAALAATGMTWWLTLGNHDENYDAPDDAHADETYQSLFGPATFSFNWGPVHFVVIDDVLWDPAARRYTAGVTEQQLAWLANDLKFVPTSSLVVYAMHIPVGELGNRDAFLACFKGRDRVLGLSAHTHTQFSVFYGAEQGWPNKGEHHHMTCATSCGSWWSGYPDEYGIPVTTMSDGGPNGWHVLTFDGNRYSSEFVPARRARDFQIAVTLPETASAAATEGVTVSANFFAGNERSTVEMRLDRAEGDWQPMARVRKPDPGMVAMSAAMQAPAEGFRKLVGASDCDHLWEAPLPAGLARGVHCVEVRARDMYGRTYEATRYITVE